MRDTLSVEDPTIQLLAVSFAFPPLAYPRSIQVARLLKYSSFSTVLICADEEGARRDPTLEADAERSLKAVVRIPFSISRQRKYADLFAHHVSQSLWNRWTQRPDRYKPWKTLALRAYEAFAKSNNYKPDVIATFSEPPTDHLIGLELKRRLNIPWLAHFSDPWVDNPFHCTDPETKKFNLAAEREVVNSADCLIFTCQETMDLVMAKYPSGLRQKGRILSQCFDAKLFRFAPPDGSKLAIRHIGNFYGTRSPAPLFAALSLLIGLDAESLKDVTFQLVGTSEQSFSLPDSLPSGLVTTCGPVGYTQSLSLMASADALLVIDAPADVSVFLPSKLIDYLGAAKPILGFTPPGAAAKLIEQVGGWVANPSETESGSDALKKLTSWLRTSRGEPWGNPEVRSQYEAINVALRFETFVKEILSDKLAV